MFYHDTTITINRENHRLKGRRKASLLSKPSGAKE
jgi:hypothetical protein